MKKDIAKISIILLVVYIVQFIVAPTMFPIYYPSTNESTALLFGLIALSAFVGMLFVSDKLRYWLLCDIPYFLLMLLYSNNGAYGIGVVGVPLDGNEVYYDRSVSIYVVLFVAALAILIQFASWVITKVVKLVAKLIRKSCFGKQSGDQEASC